MILGLAAQQTIGNLIAGTVLMSARPFRVGDRVRMQAGGVAGQVEGTVTSVGLLYVTPANGEDRILCTETLSSIRASTSLGWRGRAREAARGRQADADRSPNRPGGVRRRRADRPDQGRRR